MLLLGLTGGIATGKSSVALAAMRSAVSPYLEHVDADEIARDVTEPGQPSFCKIVAHFGRGILLPSGGIDRDKLGAAIFADPGQRRVLNAATHPFVIREMVRRTLWAMLTGRRACLWDVPLLIEGNMDRWLPVVIVVRCTPEQQLFRLLSRNPQLTEEAARQRIASQLPIDAKVARATHVIDNTGSKEDAERQTEDLLRKVVPGRFRTFFWWAVLFGPALVGWAGLTAYGQAERWYWSWRMGSKVAPVPVGKVE
ncbi:dephospho-CoA kinase-domain-containing protein [Hyaloraphidium curvatum]|nr:dephospho-CoA kinase-domain-containing protein [Hyaloraphidium curvatum]